MKVFRKISKVVLPVAITGGLLFLIATDETNKEETEYRQIDLDFLNKSVKNQHISGFKQIEKEKNEIIAEKDRLEKIRVEKMYKRIQDEIDAIKEKDRQKELAKKREEEKKKKAQINNTNQSGWMNFNGSYYGADCYKCSGITATGINVKNSIYYNGFRIIASDPKIIPLWSIVEVVTPNETFKAISLDTGGRIKNYHVDILVQSEAVSSNYGRHNVKIRIIGSMKK